MQNAGLNQDRLEKLGALRARIAAALSALDAARARAERGGPGQAPGPGGRGSGSGCSGGRGGGSRSSCGSGGVGGGAPRGACPGPAVEGPGASADYAGWTHDELVEELAINTACQRAAFALHGMVRRR